MGVQLLFGWVVRERERKARGHHARRVETEIERLNADHCLNHQKSGRHHGERQSGLQCDQGVLPAPLPKQTPALGPLQLEALRNPESHCPQDTGQAESNDSDGPDSHGERRAGPVDPHFLHSGKQGRVHRCDDFDQSRRQREAGGGAESRDPENIACDHAEHLGRGGSNSCTDRELPPLGEPAGHEQSDNVAAGNEKDEHRSGPHSHQRCTGGAYELLVKGYDTGSEPFVRGLCGLCNASGDEVHLGLGSGKRGGGPKPADNPEVALVRKRFLVRIDRQGCPDVHVRPGKKEKGLAEDPDNGERPVVQNDRGSDGAPRSPPNRSSHSR